MAMNRQMKRMLQKQREIGADGSPVAARPQQRQGAKPSEKRAGPRQYVREVRGELRKVAWPTREETINYSVIVFIAVVVLTALIFGLDFGFAKAVFFLFD